MASNKTIEIDVLVNTADSANSLKDIKGSIKELQNAALAVGEGGEGFDKLTKKSAQLKDKLDDLKDSTMSLKGSGVEKLNSSIGFLSEGFKNADPGKLSIGMKGLGMAMKAIPIFLIIEGIKFLIENFDKLTKSGGLIGKVFGFIKDVIDSVIQAFKDLTDWLGLTNNAIEDNAEKTIEAAKNAGAATQARYDDEIKLAKAAGKETFDLEIKKQKAIIESASVQINALKKVYEANGNLTDAQTKQLEELVASIHTAQIDIQVKTLENEKKTNETLDKSNKEAKDKAIAHSKKVNDERTKFAAEQQKLAAAALAEQQKNDAAELASTISLIEKVKGLRNQQLSDLDESGKTKLAIQKAADDAEIEAMYEKSNRSTEAYQAMIDAKKIIDEQYKAEIEEVDKVAAEKKAEDDLKADEKKQKDHEKDIELANDKRNAEFEIAKQSTDSIQGLSDLVFSIKKANVEKGSAAELKAAKQQFKINKALAITSTVISTIQGVMNALSATSVIPEPFGTILKVATAVGVGVAGAVNVAKIAATQFEGGGSAAASTGGAAASGGGGAAPSAPSFAPPTFGANSGAGVNGINPSGGGSNGPGPQRVFVTQTDISNQNNRVEVLQSRARIG